MVGRVQVLLRTEQLRKNMLDTSKVIETAAQNQGCVNAAQIYGAHRHFKLLVYTGRRAPARGRPTGTGTRASACASATGTASGTGTLALVLSPLRKRGVV